MKLPYMKKACSQCPFRKDTRQGWLGAERAKEILSQDSFVCHKTVEYDERKEDNQRRQCAGHMSICGKDNAFKRLAGAFGQEIELLNPEVVMETREIAIKKHTRL